MVVPVRYAPNIGGIETLVAHLLPLLQERGHDFVVVTGTDDDRGSDDVVEGVPVYRLPFLTAVWSAEPMQLLEISRRLREIERAHDVHLRHVHGLDTNLWFVLRRHRAAPAPFLLTVHGRVDDPYPFTPVTREGLQAADVVTAVSHSVKDSIEAAVPELTGRVPVIPNGLALRVVTDTGPRSDRVFMAGRLDALKGFDVAIRAVALLRDVRPHLHVRIAGTGLEDAPLRALVHALGVEDRVEMPGPCTHEQVLDEIGCASVVVVPSRAIEGFSLVALEAAHLGRPVVASRVGGLRETVVDGVTGTLVEPDDPNALARALGDLLARPERARAMGAQAAVHAARFDVRECADAYSTLYERACDDRGLLDALPTGTS